jgi:hypothetical protein
MEGDTRHLYVNLKDRLYHAHHRDPYECHIAFAEEVQKLYDKSVWSLRDLVHETVKVCNGHNVPLFKTRQVTKGEIQIESENKASYGR